jgi:hypothetical protein
MSPRNVARLVGLVALAAAIAWSIDAIVAWLRG